MRNLLSCILLSAALFTSCWGTHVNNYYSGFVIDELGNPVDSVLVKEYMTEDRAHKTLTDKNGYFRMDRTDNWLPDLILQKEGYESDTIRMVWL